MSIQNANGGFRWAMIGGMVTAIAVLVTLRATASSGSLDKPVEITKMGGDIDVDDAPGGASLVTMGGKIRLGTVGQNAKLRTMGGTIEVEGASGSLQAVTMAGDITARLLPSSSNAARTIDLSSNQGEISLVVPKNFPMTVEVALAYTNNQTGQFRITDNMGLQETRTNDWDHASGTPRKYIYAKGRTGNGQNHVVIHTINGNVTLTQK
jgi:DUF4097 and DUF4098 domain-containing protein YvlB